MKAAVLKEARKLAMEEVPDPVAEPDEVVVRVKDVGICAANIFDDVARFFRTAHAAEFRSENSRGILARHFTGEWK